MSGHEDSTEELRIEQIGHLAYAGGDGDPQADVRWLLMVLQKRTAQVQRVRDRCAFWADAGDAEADIATDILTAIINYGEGEA